MARKFVVADNMQRAMDFTREKPWQFCNWSYINSDGGNLHKLEGYAVLPAEVFVVDPPNAETNAMIKQRIDVGMATRARGTGVQGGPMRHVPVQQVVIAVTKPELESWEERLHVIMSALWDMELQHLSAEVDDVRLGIKEKYI